MNVKAKSGWTEHRNIEQFFFKFPSTYILPGHSLNSKSKSVTELYEYNISPIKAVHASELQQKAYFTVTGFSALTLCKATADSVHSPRQTNYSIKTGKCSVLHHVMQHRLQYNSTLTESAVVKYILNSI